MIDDPIIDKGKEPYLSQSPEKKHLTLKVFGKPFTLSLAPTEGLLKKGKLKIWTIEPNATAQHGIEYVEIPDEVRILIFIQIYTVCPKSFGAKHLSNSL